MLYVVIAWVLARGQAKMQLIIKQNEGPNQEFRFQRGPIYIGRQMGSQVFLPHAGVSRQHAVIYTTKQGGWVVEDLGSANKTFLNQTAIHQSELKNGDSISICEFEISVKLDNDDIIPEPPIHMEDTLVAVRHEVKTETRNISSSSAPPIKLPASKIKNFYRATRSICTSGSLTQLHSQLVDILLGHLGAHDSWVGLRTEPEGPLEYQGGRQITREMVKRSDLVVQQTLSEAMDKGKFILIQQLPREISHNKLRSVIIAPIMRERECFGALYAANSGEHEHYTMEDLDYLILLSITAAARLDGL